MKVSELIELLQNFDEDAEVHMAYGSGDHWRTTLAPKVTQVFNGAVQMSDYHQGDRLIHDEDVEDDNDEQEYKVRRVVVIE
jgi:hypothetical protein